MVPPEFHNGQTQDKSSCVASASISSCSGAPHTGTLSELSAEPAIEQDGGRQLQRRDDGGAIGGPAVEGGLHRAQSRPPAQGLPRPHRRRRGRRRRRARHRQHHEAQRRYV
jgi:hypothetical protein